MTELDLREVSATDLKSSIPDKDDTTIRTSTCPTPPISRGEFKTSNSSLSSPGVVTSRAPSPQLGSVSISREGSMPARLSLRLSQEELPPRPLRQRSYSAISANKSTREKSTISASGSMEAISDRFPDLDQLDSFPVSMGVSDGNCTPPRGGDRIGRGLPLDCSMAKLTIPPEVLNSASLCISVAILIFIIER